MSTPPTSPEDYLAALPPERRAALAAVRAVILENLGEGYEEGLQYGMIGYYVPHSVYPAGYHCDTSQPLPFASLAAQKNHLALYLTCLYCDDEHQAWFKAAWEKTGKRLNMGKSCIRFKTLEDLPLEVIGEAIRRVPSATFLAQYEAGRAEAAKAKKARAEARKAAKTKAAKAR